jgi:hypothetical protein
VTALPVHRSRRAWSVERAITHAALLGMPSGSEWAMVWCEQPIRPKAPAPLYFRRGTDPEDKAYLFTAPAEEARPIVGFDFQLFGRLVDRPSTPFFWDLAPTGGLAEGLRIEVWWYEIPLGRDLRALRTHDPLTGLDRKVVEITGPDWESSIDRARRGLRALDMKIMGGGGRPRGRTSPDPLFPEQFYSTLRKRYAGGLKDRPSQEELAEDLGVSVDTLQRYLEPGYAVPDGLPWPPPWPPE